MLKQCLILDRVENCYYDKGNIIYIMVGEILKNNNKNVFSFNWKLRRNTNDDPIGESYDKVKGFIKNCLIIIYEP